MAEDPETEKDAARRHQHQLHHEHHHHRHRSPRSFLLPDGRRVHIAVSPEEAQERRRQLSLAADDDAHPFDVVLFGSDDHRSALHRAHSHQTTRREELRQRHGRVFDEFENVRTELDHLSRDLNALTDQTVSLDANFSKFGYSAHLRTYDEPSSSAASLHDSDSPEREVRDWSAERHKVKTMQLLKRPVVRQYFHKGLLWRASSSAEVNAFELFVDLLYVGIIAINGDRTAEDATGDGLLHFVITFAMSWKIWADLGTFISWFETDDVVQRLSIIFIMACLLGFTTNMVEAFDTAYSQLIAFYLAARLFMASYLLTLAFFVPMVRGMMVAQTLCIVLPSALWIASIYVDMPNRLALIFIALFIDFEGQISIILFIRQGKKLPWLAGFIDREFEFFPAINIEHKTERTNAFVSLVLGYTVVALLYQNSASFGLNAFFGKAVMGLIQAFSLNWLYFEVDSQNLFVHSIRRSVFSASLWMFFHLPFVMAYTLSGAAISRLVVATDCPDTNVDWLTDAYQVKSEPELSSGLRWFYCAGLGIALASMGAISLTHIHRESQGVRLGKFYRLLFRFAMCAVMVCLPLATALDSLNLISVMTGLVVATLMVEVWGMTPANQSFCFGNNTCTYTARTRMSRKDVEGAAHDAHGAAADQDLSGGRGQKGSHAI